MHILDTVIILTVDSWKKRNNSYPQLCLHMCVYVDKEYYTKAFKTLKFLPK